MKILVSAEYSLDGTLISCEYAEIPDEELVQSFANAARDFSELIRKEVNTG